MALAALWDVLATEKAQNPGFVTQNEGLGYTKVTPKPAWIKAVTQITFVTQQKSNVPTEPENGAGKISNPKSQTPVKAAQAYHTHHFQCPQCIAAGRGGRYGERCDVGLGLWDAYNGTT